MLCRSRALCNHLIYMHSGAVGYVERTGREMHRSVCQCSLVLPWSTFQICIYHLLTGLVLAGSMQGTGVLLFGPLHKTEESGCRLEA